MKERKNAMKNMFLAIACLAASMAFAGKSAQELWGECGNLKGDALTAWERSLTSDDVRTLADDVLAVATTNRSAVSWWRASICARRIFAHWDDCAHTELAEEYDVKFADADIFFMTIFWKFAPKTSTKWLEEGGGSGIAKESPVWASYQRGLVSRSFEPQNAPVGLSANFLAEIVCRKNRAFNYRSVKSHRDRLIFNATKIIRRRLRERGLPITVKDGKNLVQDAVDSLASALNAPKMAGIKEWVAEWCPDYKWVECTWMTDDELAKFKDDIFYGEIPFDDTNSAILQGYLGIDEYNKFVKKFNNEE